MPYQSLPLRRVRHFVPDEAPAIEAAFRAIAKEARDLCARLRDIGLALELTWEGRAKLRFLQDLETQPTMGESTAAWLEAEARRLGSITVSVWETVHENVWVPE